MRRALPALATVLLLSTAAAQTTWDAGDYRISLQDCVRRSAAEVACTLTSTYTGSVDKTLTLFTPTSVAVVNPDGKIIPAGTLAVAGSAPSAGYQSVTMYKGQPVKVIATFAYASAGATLPRLDYYGKVLGNVALRGSAPAAATPAAADSSYAATLTDCRPGAGDTLVCTATLTPRR